MVSIVAGPMSVANNKERKMAKVKSGLELGDIYDSMEKHRETSKSQSTGAVIHASREYLIYKRPLLSAVNGGYDSLSLPPRSRASTRQESDATSQRAPSAKTLDCRTLQVALTRTGAISPNVCMRAQSALDRQIEDMVRPLSRHCCDVLGPSHCYQCNQITRQERDLSKHEAKYPLLHVSNDNISTTILVEKYMPNLNPYQIQHKIASGEISKPAYHDRFFRAKSSSEERNAPSKGASKKTIKRVLDKRRESAYFVNIRDLNSKIVSGDFTRKKALTTVSENNPNKSLTTFTERLYPLFISPRKSKKPEKPTYIACYEPPLLPKVCQNAEPSFFAGSDGKYKLPERLPDDLGSQEPPGARDVWN